MKKNFCNVLIPTTEGIKYAGSKLNLLPYIDEIMVSLKNSYIKNVLDGFSGTTRVSQYFAQKGYNTHSNDISIWSEIFAKCFLLPGNSDKYYQEIIDHLNSLEGINGWFSLNYGGLDNESKKPFKLKNMQKLDAIRNEIDKLNLNEIDFSVILTSLIFALDKVDSTIGHFSSYLAQWSQRSQKDLFLVLPKRFNIVSQNTVTRSDVFDILKNNEYDLAYFDPPYGSNNDKMPSSRVRYAGYYHFWKTVILNDQPELFGKVNRRTDSRDLVSTSIFENFRKDENNNFLAMNAIKMLIEKTNARYLLLSYSSGGRASKEQLLQIMNDNGKLEKIYEIDYQKHIMANMVWTGDWVAEEKTNKEYLILIKK